MMPSKRMAMKRRLLSVALASLLFVSLGAASDEQVSVLRIRVALVDADQRSTPVPRHALLVSDNPASSTPRRIVTAADGSATLSLRPGSYTVESDRPFVYGGKAYQWTKTIEVAAGRDVLLELTAANAEIVDGAALPPMGASVPGSTAASRDDTSLLLQWQDSVVAIWTPTVRASGFVIDPKGLIATSQRVVGTATTLEVQITPSLKVTGIVLVADPETDVALIRVDPGAIASRRAVPFACPATATRSLVEGQEVMTLGTPIQREKAAASGAVTRVEGGLVVADFVLAPGATGGPVFAEDGRVVGLTSTVDETDQQDGRWRGDARIVRVDQACDAIAAADRGPATSPAPSGTLLPVEPTRPYPPDVLEQAATRRAGSLNPYQTSSSDFDIAFITPLMIVGAQRQTVPLAVRPLLNFSNWAAYVADVPPVLLIRVTPKLVESFWTTVARGAARTQGVSIPPIKRFKSGFLRMRAFCGDAEVTPVHPFRLERRVSESDAVYEGLYVFDPGAFGPHCATARLELFSEKDPDKADIRRLDPKVLLQVWQDFASYRELK